MAIEVRCGCGQLVYADEQFAGQNVQCPHCKASVAVPVAAAAAAPPARPAPAQPLLDPKTQQTALTIVGAILFFGLMAWMKGCKDDMAKERANPPPILDRNKNR
jgi:hypothetical protein